jgi:hypothetical protein
LKNQHVQSPLKHVVSRSVVAFRHGSIIPQDRLPVNSVDRAERQDESAKTFRMVIDLNRQRKMPGVATPVLAYPRAPGMRDGRAEIESSLRTRRGTR